MQILPEFIEFIWDKSNKEKNRKSHKVEWWECEELFFNFPLYMSPDVKHSKYEERFFAFGHSNSNQLLTIVFAIRQEKIRVISARDMNKRERHMYNEKDPQV